MLRAAEYSSVPADSPLYRQLEVVAQSGWTGAAEPTSTPTLPLTRYEITLETAKAILAVTTRHQTEPEWLLQAPKATVEALRELTAELRPDLQKLSINVAATLKILDEALKAKTHEDQSTLIAAWDESTPQTETPRTVSPATPALPLSAEISESPLSDRLRIYTALSTVERRQSDPLDRASWINGNTMPDGVLRAIGPRDINNASGIVRDRAGASLFLTDWLRLRAEWSRRTQTEPALLNDLTLAGMHSQTAVGGGVDIAVLPGLTVSGEMARIEPGESTLNPYAGLFTGTRVGGGVGLSAWQNRLVLNANMARLIPENAAHADSMTTELNLGFNLSENWRLRLLYQQLFSPQAQTRAERLVAGGLSVQF